MKNEATSGNLLFAHKVAGITLTVLVSLHIAAALFHALIKKDGVLARMTGNAG
ncbi:cytochrome b/b6 domain-containing protein [Candidatus Raskinella chloraquaticus]